MILTIIKLTAGLICILVGANYLVDSSVAIAKRFNIPDMVIGMTLVALGTSAPEIVVSFVGAAGGSSDIAIGNVIGSNICNILLVLGLATLIFPLTITSENKKVEIPCVLGATLLVLILSKSFFNGFSVELGRLSGFILLLAGVAFLIYSYIITIREQSRNEQDINTDKTQEQAIPKLFRKIYNKRILVPIASGVFIISCLLLVWGGNSFVEGAKELARRIGMSEMTIAATIVAVGTSLPELATSVAAAFKKNSGIALGNIVGSNVLNICIALGGSALIHPLKTTIQTSHLLFFALSAALLFIFAIVSRIKFHRIYGLLFVSLYIAYIISIAAH